MVPPASAASSDRHPAVVPYGRWPSPVRAEDAASGKVSLSELCSDGVALYWLESRPADGGRVVFVRWDGRRGSEPMEISPGGASIRSRVHEYGGGAVCLVPQRAAGACVYVELSDQRVWFMDGAGSDPVPLTGVPPEGERWAHGGLSSSGDGRFVVAVREVISGHGITPARSIMAFPVRGQDEPMGATTLLTGHDFYGAPALHPNSTAVAGAAWDHPDMQWDFSRMEVVPLVELAPAEGISPPRLVPAGPVWSASDAPDDPPPPGRPVCSVGQPWWRRDGRLMFVSDRHGWWQPFVHGTGGSVKRLSARPAEFHGADFVLSLRTMAELSDGTVVAAVTSDGKDELVALPETETTGDVPSHTLVLDQPCIDIAAVCAHGKGVACIGTTADGASTVWVIPEMGAPAYEVRPHQAPALGPDGVSVGESFSLSGRSGRPVHGVFFPPRLSATSGPDGTPPPLVVHCHSGPTSRVRPGFDLTVQYFTSRGFAVAAVDYAGSTGYGREYRCSLWGQWGRADTEDCQDAARHLAARGAIDGMRMAIRGGSSGGLTALNALIVDGGEDDGGNPAPAFRAAVAWYGVTDLAALAASTHDFEAHYLDRLIGPLPEARARYDQRSPVHRGAAMRGSVLLLQGLDDPVVPPSQAEALQQSLLAAGRRCEARFFAGEGHGFRRQETLVACLEAELAFYREELDL